MDFDTPCWLVLVLLLTGLACVVAKDSRFVRRTVFKVVSLVRVQSVF